MKESPIKSSVNLQDGTTTKSSVLGSDLDAGSRNQFDAIYERLLKATQASTASRFAEILGISQQAVVSAKKKNKLPPSWITTIASKMGVSSDWLLFGEGDMRRGEAPIYNDKENQRICTDETELVMVPMVRARLSAGGGSWETGGDVCGKYAFRNDFLARKGNPGQMVLMRVAGDSMEPKIEDGDTVLIDQSQTKPEPGKIYGVAVEDLVYLKRIDTLPGRMILKSYNSSYPAIEIDVNGDLETSIRIIGHVVWVGRELP